MSKKNLTQHIVYKELIEMDSTDIDDKIQNTQKDTHKNEKTKKNDTNKNVKKIIISVELHRKLKSISANLGQSLQEFVENELTLNIKNFKE